MCLIVCKYVTQSEINGLKNYLTWYSLLNPLFSFKDMFVICAFIFLIEMFLLVGGPRLVFSGKAYVIPPLSFAFNICDMQPIMYTFELLWVFCHNPFQK